MKLFTSIKNGNPALLLVAHNLSDFFSPVQSANPSFNHAFGRQFNFGFDDLEKYFFNLVCNKVGCSELKNLKFANQYCKLT